MTILKSHRNLLQAAYPSSILSHYFPFNVPQNLISVHPCKHDNSRRCISQPRYMQCCLDCKYNNGLLLNNFPENCFYFATNSLINHLEGLVWPSDETFVEQIRLVESTKRQPGIRICGESEEQPRSIGSGSRRTDGINGSLNFDYKYCRLCSVLLLCGHKNTIRLAGTGGVDDDEMKAILRQPQMKY